MLAANAAGAVVGGFLLDGKDWLPPTVEVGDRLRDPVVRDDGDFRIFLQLRLLAGAAVYAPGR